MSWSGGVYCKGGRATSCRLSGVGGRDNNDNNVNANDNFNNNTGALPNSTAKALQLGTSLMKTYVNLFVTLCSWQNLEEAYLNARKHKMNTHAVLEFEEHWQLHLVMLLKALHDKTYRPLHLKTFVLRDPKTRVICVSSFRDRVVHHVLVNVLQPLFEPRFIGDSYGSRAGKGTLPALYRFEVFAKKCGKDCLVLKPVVYAVARDHSP